jgi:hypothetical protein
MTHVAQFLSPSFDKQEQEEGTMPRYRYEVEPRPLDLGGGFRLRLFEDGEEVGVGGFPLDEYPEVEREEAGKMAFTDAQNEGTDWMASRNKT